MANTRRAQKVQPNAVAESLADHLLNISVEKWSAGPPPHDNRMKRYRGFTPLNTEGVSLFEDERWTGDDQQMHALGREIDCWLDPDGESRGDAALAFFTEVTGFKPRAYQVQIVKRLYRKRRLCVRSPRGAGKSAIMANIIIHFGTVNNPCKVPTTAGSWAQLEEYLWPEINLWIGRADWSLIGIKPKPNLLDFSLGGSDDGLIKPPQRAFAIASDKPELMEGAHSENVLFGFDESKAIPPATFDAVEGTLSHEGAYAIAVSTPGPPNGRFYEIQSHDPKYADWDVMSISLQDQLDALVGPAREAKQKWADDRLRQWGADSPMYRNHVLGEFADTGDDTIIPLEWVLAAVERGKLWAAAGYPEVEEYVGDVSLRAIGADIAGQGKDKTCLASRIGWGIKPLEFRHRATTMETANSLMARTTAFPNILIEADGLGVGVYERCREIQANQSDLYKEAHVQSVIAGSKTTERDKSGELGFWNMRSYLWWKMRERLEPGSGVSIMLPDDKTLIADLTTPKYELREGSGEFKGRIKVESKDEIRKRLSGRSTDAADAVIIVLGGGISQIVVGRVTVAPSTSGKVGTSFYDVSGPRQWPGFRARR